MPTLPLFTWLGNAFAVLFGQHGAVTQQAQQAGCSRQAAYDHADKVQQAVADAQLPGPCREHLLRHNRLLQDEVAALRQQVESLRASRIDFGPDAQRRWAVTLTAWGISLRQLEALFAGLLGTAAPDHATLGRWTAAAAQKAKDVLAVLDEALGPLVRELALDEIFVRGQPVLVGVDPASLVLALCRRAADCTGPTWAGALQPFPALEYAISDGGTGLRAGLTALQQQRATALAQASASVAAAGAAAGPAPAPAGATAGKALELGRDVFHISLDAEPQLRRLWRAVEHAWQRAEAADAALARTRRRGVDAGAAVTGARHAWARAAKALAAYEAREAPWRRAQAALRVFRPDGRLNDPGWAAAEVEAACAALPGEPWAAVRRALRDERTLTPLRRLHRRLAEAEPRAELRQALVRLLEWERQARQASPEEAGRWTVRLGLQRRVCALQAADWELAYDRVQAVVRSVVRASSCVECVNGVLRMHQARHRKMTQGLLDLKRLWWNCHRFSSGRRAKACPYQLVGLRLPTYDFWQLLQLDVPTLRDRLKQELSSEELAA
jgi:hypothetical protein